MTISRALVIVSIVFPFAACDTRSGIDLAVAQEFAAGKAESDAVLEVKVARAIGIDVAPFAFDVKVRAQDGNVELWGTVGSSATRKRLEIISAGVVGVRSVVNRLQVDPGA
jgi:osmotically-inducible protein OsmY